MTDVLTATQTTLGTSLDDVHLEDTSIVQHEAHPLVGYLSSEEARPVPTRALVGAVAAWFGLIYALCYVALPTAASAVGLYSNLIPNLVVNTFALLPAAVITLGLVALTKPDVVTQLQARRDPVIAATLGSLLVWFGLVEAIDVVQPLSGMPWYQALTFVGFNIIEQSMFGMMLASFVRTPGKAFLLGAAFQLLLLSLFVGFIS